MLVASNPSDLAAAAACGLRTCYVSRPLEYGPGVVVEEPLAKGRFDLMVEDLSSCRAVRAGKSCPARDPGRTHAILDNDEYPSRKLWWVVLRCNVSR
jgi:hypothetical protein